MFRANMGKAFLGPHRPLWVDQLLSCESLARTGWFDPAGVQYARDMQFCKPQKSLRRLSLDMGLVAVIATQLWHHLYFGGGLADLPTWSPPKLAKTALTLNG
jgi:asparagine synthase (glutamine-hydrolysing)